MAGARRTRGSSFCRAVASSEVEHCASRSRRGPRPIFGLYLVGHQPDPTPWPYRWLRWPDFRLPFDPAAARDALIEVWERAADQRVEVACGGGRGRTGTALACLAVLDGVAPSGAVAYVRQHFDHGAVETPWQSRYVARFNRR